MSRLSSETVFGDGATTFVTTYQRDQRGYVTGTTDPRGYVSGGVARPGVHDDDVVERRRADHAGRRCRRRR